MIALLDVNPDLFEQFEIEVARISQVQLGRYGWDFPSSAANFRSEQDDTLRAARFLYEFDLPTDDAARFEGQLWCKLPPRASSPATSSVKRRCDTNGPMPHYHLDVTVEAIRSDIRHFKLALSE